MEAKREMVALGRGGEYTLEELGGMFGVTRERARQILAGAGITARRGRKGRSTSLAKRFPPDTHAEIRAYAATHGVTAAVRRYHTSSGTLHRYIGVPPVERRKVSDDELRTLRAAGLSGSAISRELGMAIGAMSLRLRRLGLNGVKGDNHGGGGAPTHRKGLGAEIRRLRAEGCSYTQIASQLDCSVATIHYHLGKRRRPRATV